MKLASAFESWGRDIQILARCMDQNVSAWPLFGTWPPLPVYVKGRVALLGDAVSFFFLLNDDGFFFGSMLTEILLVVNTNDDGYDT